MAEGEESEVSRCAKLFRTAKTDNERLAALFMVSVVLIRYSSWQKNHRAAYRWRNLSIPKTLIVLRAENCSIALDSRFSTAYWPQVSMLRAEQGGRSGSCYVMDRSLEVKTSFWIRSVSCYIHVANLFAIIIVLFFVHFTTAVAIAFACMCRSVGTGAVAVRPMFSEQQMASGAD